jgi:hypothetical protein
MKPGSEVPFLDGMDFGKGVDTLELTPRGIGVADANGAQPAAVSGGGGDTIVFRLQRTESVEDLYSALNLNTSVAAVFGLFGGDATFDFAESQRFHSFSQFAVASITVTKAFKKIPRPQLDPASDAAELVSNGQKERFREEFGDMFVLGARMGGAYFAVFEFTAQSEQDAQNVSASLDAGEFGVFATSDNFSLAISKFKGSSSLKIQAFQTGGNKEAQETNIDAVIKKATNFAAELGDQGVPFLAVLQDYASLKLPAPPNFVDIQAAADVLANYATLRNDIIGKINDVEYIQLHPQQFLDVDKYDLQGTLTALTNALNQLKKNASDCVNAPKDAKLPDITIPPVKLPSRVPGVAGMWQHITRYNGQDYRSQWTLTPTDAGSYKAQETGLGSASGFAVLNGTHLKISWATGSEQGAYDWNLDAAFTEGDGVLTFLAGTRAGTQSTGSHVSRLSQ